MSSNHGFPSTEKPLAPGPSTRICHFHALKPVLPLLGLAALAGTTLHAETRPDMLCQMEVELFKAGNEARASARMLSHINSHITHKGNRKWVEELQAQLGGKEPEGAQP